MHPKLQSAEVIALENRVKEMMLKHPPKSFEFGPLEVIFWAATHLTMPELALLKDIEKECGWEISNPWWMNLLATADEARDVSTQPVALA
jgi:hypothetical protein